MPRNDLKAYTSVIARLPQELADQVKHYAGEYGATVSDLIRQGLEMRLAAHSSAPAPGTRRDTEVLQEVLHRVEALAPMLRTQLEDTVRTALSEVLREVLQEESSVHAVKGEGHTEVVPKREEVLQEVLQGHTEVVQQGKVIQGHTSVPESLETTCSGGTTEVVPRVEVIQGHTSVAQRKGRTKVVPQETAPKHRGRPPVLRPGILALLDKHPEGLTAAELKVYLGTEKHIGDTLAGMVKAQLLVRNGKGQGLRYQRADVAGKDAR